MKLHLKRYQIGAIHPNDPWYIPAVPTGKPEFGAPNRPVRALSYYHSYLTEHPELRKDRRRLFVPIKDNNAAKELSASTISRWICTTIVDSHQAGIFPDLLKLTKYKRWLHVHRYSFSTR